MPSHAERVVERARTAAMGDPAMDPTAQLEQLKGEVADLSARVAQLEEQATQDAVADLTAWSGRSAAIQFGDHISETVIAPPAAEDGPLPAETDSEETQEVA